MKNTLGRSMIEMLGVLAIIGVLSIGGLYAYRQAMMRHKLNQLENFIGYFKLGVFDVCINADSCPFDGNTSANPALCKAMGGDFCKTASPFFGSSWILYIVPQPTITRFGVYFGGVNTQECKAIVQHQWNEPVYHLGINNLNSSTGATQADLLTACDNAPNQIWLAFKGLPPR